MNQILFQLIARATSVGEKMAQAYEIETVPTMIINAETKLVDPPEQKLRQEIEKAFAPIVEPIIDPQFNFDPQMKPNVELLAELKT